MTNKSHLAYLEIDAERGVIYVHSVETGQTLLRICQLPTPIPDDGKNLLDLIWGVGVSWSDKKYKRQSKQVLTDKQIRQIWSDSRKGVSQSEIAKKYGVTQRHISRILRGLTRKKGVS